MHFKFENGYYSHTAHREALRCSLLKYPGNNDFGYRTVVVKYIEVYVNTAFSTVVCARYIIIASRTLAITISKAIISNDRTMSSEAIRSRGESYADEIRQNDKSLTNAVIDDWASDVGLEILDALKNNTSVKEVFISDSDDLPLQVNQEALVKLSEVMQCNKSVQCFTINVPRGLLRERLFATMATSGGWSSIKELVLGCDCYDSPAIEHLSFREHEHLSSFINQSDNLHTLRLGLTGDAAAPIVETLSRTKIQSLDICFVPQSSIQNGGRQLGTALERCTCITELRLELHSYDDQVEFFQILLIESIPKMLGLKKFDLCVILHSDQQLFDMVGQCIGGHQGEIEELRFLLPRSIANPSILGLAPALRRLKVIKFGGRAALTFQKIRELSGVAADCDALEEFGCNLSSPSGISNDDFKAICQLLSKFPSLKRVTQDDMFNTVGGLVNLDEECRSVAFLEMIKTSKTIEQIPLVQCRNAEEEAAIKHHCRNNMIHNRIRENGFLAATVPSSAWPLILKEFSDMPDVLYYLLQHKHGAMVCPTRQCCKRKQESASLHFWHFWKWYSNA